MYLTKTDQEGLYKILLDRLTDMDKRKIQKADPSLLSIPNHPTCVTYYVMFQKIVKILTVTA